MTGTKTEIFVEIRATNSFPRASACHLMKGGYLPSH